MLHELDYRENQGIRIALYWNDADNSVLVHVEDAADTFTLHPPNADAWDCFNHPYAWRDATAYADVDFDYPELTEA